MIEEDRKTFKLTFKDQRRIINKEITLLDLVVEKEIEIERLKNIIKNIEEHFVFLKMNSTGGNKEFMEDILDYIKALKELKGSSKE